MSKERYGTGNVVFRAGRWERRFWRDGTPQTQVIEPYITDPSEQGRKAALKALESTMAAIREGRAPSFSAERLTVAKAMTEYEKYATNLKTRARSFTTQCKIVREGALARYKVTRLSRAHIAKWMDILKAEGYSPDSVATLTGYLRAALRHVQETYRIPFIPRMPEVEGKTHKTRCFDSPEDYEQVRPFIRPPVALDVCDFISACGWRRSEPRLLQWIDVSMEKGIIILRAENEKTRRGGAIAIVGRIEEVIRRRLELRRGPWVFHDEGEVLNPDRITYALKAACRAAGVEERTPHDLRRSVPQWLLKAGKDVPSIMDLTHHKSIEVFKRHYASMGIDHIREIQLDLETARATASQIRVRGQLLEAMAQENQALTAQSRLTTGETQVDPTEPKVVETVITHRPSILSVPTVSNAIPCHRPPQRIATAMLVQAHRSLLELGLGRDWRVWG